MRRPFPGDRAAPPRRGARPSVASRGALMPRKMTPEEIRAFLSHGTRTAKVATSGPGGQPHVMPVWFALDGEELVFTTWGDSAKGRNLRRDPRAAMVVDEEVARSEERRVGKEWGSRWG